MCEDFSQDIEAAHRRYAYILERLNELCVNGGMTHAEYERARDAALNERNAILDFIGVSHVE